MDYYFRVDHMEQIGDRFSFEVEMTYMLRYRRMRKKATFSSYITWQCICEHKVTKRLPRCFQRGQGVLLACYKECK